MGGVVHGEMEFDDYLGMAVAGDVDEYGEGEYIEPHTRILKIPPDT